MKKYLVFLITFLVIGLVLWFADLDGVLDALRGMDVKIIVLACLMQLLTMTLLTVQKYAIVRQMGEPVPFRGMLQVNMAGTFFDAVTPAVKAGGEATKVYLLVNRLKMSGGQAVALVGIEKTVSMTAFMLINLVSILWFIATVGLNTLYSRLLLGSFGLLLVVLGLFIALLCFPHHLKALVSRFFKKQNQERLDRFTEQFIRAVKSAWKQKKLIFRQLLLAIFIWLFYGFKSYFISRGLGLTLNFPAVCVITYLTYMVAMLPTSPGSIGTFEGTMTFLLAALHVGVSEAMAMAMVVRFVTYWFEFLVSGVFIGISSLWSNLKTSRQLKNI